MKYFTLLIMALTSLVAPGWFSRLRSRLPRWNVLTNSQKVAFVSFISLTVILPIITLATLTETRLASRAVEPVTPPITPPNTPTPPPPAMTPIPTPTRFIQVKFPNGGEMLYVGQTYRIGWGSSGNIDKVSLGYTTGPGSLNWIATNISNTGYYDWKVFVGNTTNTKFKIYIIGYQTGYGSAYDQSDWFFNVLSSPPPTLTPTPTPSLTPIPSPPPPPNIAPRIRTWFLPPGRINRNYRANVVGTDRNQNDNLTLTTAGLPAGIIQGPCSTGIQNKNVRISCVMSGRPTAAGIYPVHVVLTDNHGGKTENDIFIIIYNFFGLF